MDSGEAEGLEGGCRVGWGSDGRNAGLYKMNGIRRGRGPGRRLQGAWKEAAGSEAAGSAGEVMGISDGHNAGPYEMLQ